MTSNSSAPTDRELVRSLGAVGVELLGGFGELRQSQRVAIPPVLLGESVLLACATASGKTEAILAPLISRVLDLSPPSDRPAILAIAPTRALVNDLHKRLSGPLDRIGATCARQSSDHKANLSKAFMLVTTPESLDSLLVRRTVFSDDGLPVDHELSQVKAVFIDEIHLFDNTVRGDQLQWLLARLRRVTELSPQKGAIQICAASATVSRPDRLAAKILGKNATVVRVDGTRSIKLFCARSSSWLTITDDWAIKDFRARVNVIDEDSKVRSICELVWNVLAHDHAHERTRKMLIFTPTRQLCDELSTAVNAYLRERRAIKVLAHHGSLSKTVREHSEVSFNDSRDAVMVATTTLEVGIDIGDVDAVMLVGPAADTAGLLQRIGRSGRKAGITRIVALGSGPIEIAAMASMLSDAQKGVTDEHLSKANWSVVVQQVASFTRQSGWRGRRIADILQLAENTWGRVGKENTEAIVAHLIDSRLLARGADNRVTVDGDWVKHWDGLGMHGNIGRSSRTVPLIDKVTGTVIAQIPSENAGSPLINIAGRQWAAELRGGELVAVESTGKASDGGLVRYGGSRVPVSQAFGHHVAAGLGLTKAEIALIQARDGVALFHFGGSDYEQIILRDHQFKKAKTFLPGICILLPAKDFEAIRQDFRNLEPAMFPSSTADQGAWRSCLPDSLPSAREDSKRASDAFKAWVQSREFCEEAGARDILSSSGLLSTQTTNAIEPT